MRGDAECTPLSGPVVLSRVKRLPLVLFPFPVSIVVVVRCIYCCRKRLR